MGKWSRASGLELARRAGRALSAAAARDVVWWAMALLLCIGIVLRMRGMWLGRTISLWGDEAGWAIRLIDSPLRAHVLRSLGFMAVAKLLLTLFSASEQVLRFLPWCAGVGAVLISPLLAGRLFRSPGARLFFVGLMALHPGAIDLSKEFKPYSVAFFLHLLLLFFVLRYVDEGRERDLMTSIAIAFFGFMFSQDLVLAYPAVFGLLALTAFRAKKRDHLVSVIVGAGFTLALLLAVRHNVSSKLGDMDQGALYWGNKYNVFYVERPDSSRLGWTMSRLFDLASMPGKRRELWTWASLAPETLEAAKRVDAGLWVSLCGAGALALCWRRHFLKLALLTAPLATLVGFNYFGYWPLGDFRTNLFTLAYFGALAAAALDTLSSAPLRMPGLLPVALVVLPFLTVGRSSHSRKDFYSVDAHFMQAAQALVELQGKGRGEVLVLDAPSCGPWQYYERYHPDGKRAKLWQRFQAKCDKSVHGMIRLVREALNEPNARAFMLASGDKQTAALKAKLPKDLRVVDKELFGKDETVVLSVVKRTK